MTIYWLIHGGVGFSVVVFASRCVQNNVLYKFRAHASPLSNWRPSTMLDLWCASWGVGITHEVGGPYRCVEFCWNTYCSSENKRVLMLRKFGLKINISAIFDVFESYSGVIFAPFIPWQKQQQQQQLFYGPLSGTTRVSPYQKKHSPTHHNQDGGWVSVSSGTGSPG